VGEVKIENGSNEDAARTIILPIKTLARETLTRKDVGLWYVSVHGACV